MALDIRVALTQVEQAIVNTIRYALQLRNAAVADVAALRAVTTQGSTGPLFRDGDSPRMVIAEGVCFDFSTYSHAPDDGVNVIQPTDVTGGLPGRWLRTTSTVGTGYLRRVLFWNGEYRPEEFEQRIYGLRPCVVLVWEGSKNEARSTIPGAIYDYPCSFSLWCVSSNLRPDQEALYGGGVPSETTITTSNPPGVDPGAIRIVGDVKKLLSDENKKIVDKLGLGGGVKLITFGDESIVDIDWAERKVIVSLGMDALASVENPDLDSEHQAMSAIAAQADLTELNGQSVFDPANYVVSGYRVTPSAGLTQTPSSGSAYIAGVLVSSSPSPVTFAAGADTYRDLKPDGTFTYAAVGNGLDAPPVTSGAMRIAVTVTDGLGVVSDTYLVATSAPYADAQVIPKP